MKKKFVSLLLCVAMLAAMLPAVLVPAAAEAAESNAITFDTSWYNDTDSTLYIEDAADLLGFSYLLSGEVECNQTLASVSDSQKKFLGKTIKLTADIDLNPGWDASAGTEPANIWLAGSYHSFSGMFDGQGHTISGVYLNKTGNHVGIFGNAKGGTAENPIGVKNLAIVNSYLSNSVDGTTNNNLAAIFGSATWTSERHNILIENVYVDAVLVGIHKASNINGHIGGFIGSVNPGSTVTIKNSVFAGSITAATDLRDFGGFIGYVGDSSNITLQNCAFTGSVKSGGNRVSGFIGEVVASATVLIEHCLEAGDVIPASWAAGAEWNSSFFGRTVGTNVTVRNSIYTDITNKGGTEVTHSPNPLNTANKAPVMENLVYIPDAEMVGFSKTVKDALTTAGMTDWTVTTTGAPLPKALLSIAPIAKSVNTSTNICGYQTTKIENDRFDVRLVATVDALTYDQVGFRVVVNYGSATATVDKNISVVYNSLIGVDENDVRKEYTAEELGGSYIFALNCIHIPANAGVVTFEVTSYHVNGENIIIDETVCFTVDPAKLPLEVM